MKDRRRHKRTYTFLRALVTPFFKMKFNFEYEEGGKIEGPYLLLVNHNLELDPVLVGMAFPEQMYFVASEHILRKGFGTWLLMRYFKPIIRTKGKVEVKTVAETLRTLRKGISVCIFAEGNRSFNGCTGEVLPATGKLAKKSGVKLVTYKIEGGYFTQPRWGTTLRRGKMIGKIVNEYTPEQLKSMSETEINEAIKTDLYEDAYETQARVNIPFKGKKLALGMESTLFICPECGEIGTMVSDDNYIGCQCGMKYKYDEYGYLTDEKGKKRTIAEWDGWQYRELENIVRKTDKQDEPFFEDEVTLYSIGKSHEIAEQKKGTLAAYKDRIECCGQAFYYKDMLGFSIVSRNFIVMNIRKDAEQYEIKGDLRFNALKYLYIYELMRGEEL